MEGTLEELRRISNCPEGATFSQLSLRKSVGAYCDSVIHSDYAWCRPGGSLGLLSLGPGSHSASEHHLATARLDRDTVGVDQRAAPECLLDLVLDLGRRRRCSRL